MRSAHVPPAASTELPELTARALPLTIAGIELQMRTDWTPLLREFQPRFSEDSEIELPSIKPSLLPDNSELKMSFSFDHDHYVTEWISIANGNGKFLNSLRFFLTYSGDHITDVSWKLVCPPPSKFH